MLFKFGPLRPKGSLTNVLVLVVVTALVVPFTVAGFQTVTPLSPIPGHDTPGVDDSPGRVVAVTAVPGGHDPGPWKIARDAEITISLAGDVLLDTNALPHLSLEGWRQTWTTIAPVFGATDYALVNLECPVADCGQPIPDKKFLFRASPDSLEGLVAAGVNLVTIANNHILDYGREALLATVQNLDHYGIRFCGAGADRAAAWQPLEITGNGLRGAILAFSQVVPAGWAAGDNTAGIASAYEIEDMLETVAAAAAGYDFVLVSLHWGQERAASPSPAQQELATRLLAAGAMAVVGHHPHVLQGIQATDGRLVAYSLGNLVFTAPDGSVIDGAVLNWGSAPRGIKLGTGCAIGRCTWVCPPLQDSAAVDALARITCLSAAWDTAINPEGYVLFRQ